MADGEPVTVCSKVPIESIEPMLTYDGLELLADTWWTRALAAALADAVDHPCASASDPPRTPTGRDGTVAGGFTFGGSFQQH